MAKMRQGILLWVMGTATYLANGCAPDATVGEAWTRTELVFGLSKPGGGAVSAAEWRNFLDTVVTPRFPAGLTVLQSQGRYEMNDHSLIEEPSEILILLHHNTAEENAKIDAIIQAYIQRFGQESVLREDSLTRVQLIKGPSAKGTPK